MVTSMMKWIVYIILFNGIVFAQESKISYSYGIHDFMLDNSHVLGINGGIEYKSVVFSDLYQDLSFYTQAEYDPKKHDPDHIPIWFKGDYYSTKKLYDINDNLSIDIHGDIIWKMNTYSGIEQNLKAGIGLGIKYHLENFTAAIKVLGGTYYIEFDDDVPREFGFSRDELTVGYVSSMMYNTNLQYALNKKTSIRLSYAVWNEVNKKRLEEDISFAIEYNKNDKYEILLNIDNTKYNLAKYKKGNTYILPWDSDLMFKLSVKIPF